MRSKAARMSSNVNPVHEQIIHCETMKKENRFADRNRMENF
jgi:hypothetical protein